MQRVTAPPWNQSSCVQHVKVSSPDYVSTNEVGAINDFYQRMRHYEAQNESLDDTYDKDLSFIKIFNQGEKFLINKVQGRLVACVRVRSHRHTCEYLYTGSSKHEFACISMAAVHTDTSSVQVRVTCEFHSYEQFLCRSCSYPTAWNKQHQICI